MSISSITRPASWPSFLLSNTEHQLVPEEEDRTLAAESVSSLHDSALTSGDGGVVDEQAGGTPSKPGKARQRRRLAKRNLFIGRAAFCIFRAFSPVLQYVILSRGWTRRLLFALRLVPYGQPSQASKLSLREKLLIVFSTIIAARQIVWCIAINDTAISVYDALHVSLYNAAVDTWNSLLSTWVDINRGDGIGIVARSFSATERAGMALFAAGSYIETVAEFQRKRFRAREENSGRLCNTGLFSLARHINYGGTALWRSGVALFTGAWVALLNPMYESCVYNTGT
ncbi:hypothetical protein HK101_010212 [Irineochytrium annulatum]|nr:hypothetical protein HK101_010212 [Irineochytrium annulatum]